MKRKKNYILGYINEITKLFDHFNHVDADRERFENDIPNSCITSVAFNDCFSKHW